MVNTLEINELVEKIRRVIRGIQTVRPNSRTMIGSAQRLLDEELARGPRKAYLSRLLKSIISEAREIFNKEQFALLMTEIENEHFGSASAIDVALNSGRIDSHEIFRAILVELDQLIAGQSELGAEQESRVAAVNRLLADYETKQKI